MEYGEALKKIRKGLSLTQQEMATRLNIKQSYYSALERGSKKITSDIISSLVNNIGVNPEWLHSSNGTIFNDKLRGDNAVFLHSEETMQEKNKGFVQNTSISEDSQEKSRKVIFEKKLADYLSKNPDIHELHSASYELLGFEYMLGETVKRYIDRLLLITGNNENMSFEELKDTYYNYIEGLRPIKKPLLNLAEAIRTFYKEMYESGDNSFDFAENMEN